MQNTQTVSMGNLRVCVIIYTLYARFGTLAVIIFSVNMN